MVDRGDMLRLLLSQVKPFFISIHLAIITQ